MRSEANFYKPLSLVKIQGKKFCFADCDPAPVMRMASISYNVPPVESPSNATFYADGKYFSWGSPPTFYFGTWPLYFMDFLILRLFTLKGARNNRSICVISVSRNLKPLVTITRTTQSQSENLIFESHQSCPLSTPTHRLEPNDCPLSQWSNQISSR